MKSRFARVTLLLAVVLTAACGSGGGSTAISSSPGQLVVCSLDKVSLFGATAIGNASPEQVFAQAADSNRPAGIAVDAVNREVVVARANSLDVYAKAPTGEIVPLRTISGDLTGLAAPVGIAVDASREEIFVTNFANNSITVYPRTAIGNVAPLRTTVGAATGLDGARAIAVDAANNEILVAVTGGRILAFAAKVNGDVAPLRAISCPEPAEFSGIAVDGAHREILASRFRIIDRYTYATSVVVYGMGAEGEAIPLRAIEGEPSGPAGPMTGIAVDPGRDEVFVTHASSNSVEVYQRTASGRVAPLRTIAGDATGLKSPSSLGLGTL